MKTWALLCTCALVLGFAVAALANEEGDAYDMMYMKPAIAANMALQKNVGTDLSAAAMNAADLKAAFAKIEAFWAKKNASDAVGFAKNIQDAASKVQAAAGAGDKDGAAAAAKMIGGNCGMCHMAHRTKTDSGFDLH